MKQLMILAAVVMLAVPAMADTFGTGANQFTIDFVPISGATNPTSGYGIANYDYRMGTYQITNSQWDAFEAESRLNFTSSRWKGDQKPVNMKNWYAAAQFVNWLNTENGHQAAYNFDGGTFNVWDVTDAWRGTNLFRHKDAFYFLPTEDEWVKAAYWNGTSLQPYATKEVQGNPTTGGWNIYDYSIGTHNQPWDVGSGSEELNGTYDMMGNVYEWIETPYFLSSEGYTPGWPPVIRGGSYQTTDISYLSSHSRSYHPPTAESYVVGFRVASVPEPTSLILLSIGGLILRRRPCR